MTLFVPLADGKTVETATIGCEGAAAASSARVISPAFGQAVVQVGGTVIRIEAERLTQAKESSKPIRDLFDALLDCLLPRSSSPSPATPPSIEKRCLAGS